MDPSTRSAYTAFAAAQWPRLVRAGVLLGLDRHAAEDLAQGTLVRCYVKWSRVERADDPTAYAAKVLLHLHRTQRRRRWHGEVPTAELPDAVGRGTGDDLADLRAALARLSREHREVVLARVHLGLPEKQAATLLGVRPGTVKSRLSRALARLAEDPALADHAPARPDPARSDPARSDGGSR